MALAYTNWAGATSTTGASASMSNNPVRWPIFKTGVVCAYENASTASPGTLADSGGNTWTLLTTVNGNNLAANGILMVWTSPMTISVANMSTTYTKVTSGSNVAMSQGWISNGLGPIDWIGVPLTNFGSSTTPSIPNIPIANNDLLIAILGYQGGGTLTNDSNWQTGDSRRASSAAVALQFQIGTATGPRNWNPTIGSTAPWATIGFAYTQQFLMGQIVT